MDIKDSFWKEASKKVESLLQNPVKVNNEDLLINGLKDLTSNSQQVISKTKYKTKASSFNNRYTNYKPVVMTVLKNSQKFSIYHKMRTEITPSPLFQAKNNQNYHPDENFDINFNFLEIFGQRAGFSYLPKLSNPLKIKNFLIRVKEKYFNLQKCLQSDDRNIRIEGIMEYLSKQDYAKRHFSINKATSAGFRSESRIRRPKVVFLDKIYSNYIQDQAKFIMVIKK